MKIFLINTDLEHETLRDFINFYNSTDESEYVQIIIKSGGGYCYVADEILDIINSDPERFTLIATRWIYSSAFDLFMKAKCKRILKPNTVGMIHEALHDITFSLNGRSHPETKVLQEAYKSNLKEDMDYLTNFLKLSKQEIKDYNNQKDVYFNHTRLLEILNNTNQ
ncbi:ATP-dependent Clp protease proteolytic subunit [Elizabethkingia bruuniana]|uniref:ATP-dependent Clp protease proteolytic subunit n=1 Tax=Elizabethkingia bruuniana TaxID=1756149 RepID=UPI002012F473|nr:ATP-dependent Clp protease proteolytic subunit [Elizabethkingia bruuniana]MCL1636261.1 ATP-dependent Clp protease proteolytic subunit [Elizabethkingia bruuniana]